MSNKKLFPSDEKDRERAEEALEQGNTCEAFGILMGGEGYGEKKPGFTGKPTVDSKTIHEIRAEFTNSRAKSQLMFCKECETETMHRTPFFGHPFRCVVNHGGTTRCSSCDYDIVFIARVIVTGQHDHEAYCSSCDEENSNKKEV